MWKRTLSPGNVTLHQQADEVKATRDLFVGMRIEHGMVAAHTMLPKQKGDTNATFWNDKAHGRAPPWGRPWHATLDYVVANGRWEERHARRACSHPARTGTPPTRHPE